MDAAPDCGCFEKPLEFGEAYCELGTHGWVVALAWSPSGDSLCFAGERLVVVVHDWMIVT